MADILSAHNLKHSVLSSNLFLPLFFCSQLKKKTYVYSFSSVSQLKSTKHQHLHTMCTQIIHSLEIEKVEKVEKVFPRMVFINHSYTRIWESSRNICISLLTIMEFDVRCSIVNERCYRLRSQTKDNFPLHSYD